MASPFANYRPIFIVVAVLSLICVVIISGTGESQSDEKRLISGKEDKLHEEEKAKNEIMLGWSITKQENRSLLKLAFVNALNGLGAGMAGHLIAYWFHLKYGVDTAISERRLPLVLFYWFFFYI